MPPVERYAVLRVPSSGQKGVVGEPWLFETQREAEARIAELTADHLVVHHTYLEVILLRGEVYAALDNAAIVY